MLNAIVTTAASVFPSIGSPLEEILSGSIGELNVVCSSWPACPARGLRTGGVVAKRRRMKPLLVIALLTVAACATKPRSDLSWRRAGDHAEPPQPARPACTAYGLEKSKAVSDQGLAAKVAAGAFAECMRDRGWVLSDQAE